MQLTNLEQVQKIKSSDGKKYNADVSVKETLLIDNELNLTKNSYLKIP